MATITRRTSRTEKYDSEIRSLLLGGGPKRGSVLVHARMTPESLAEVRALDPRAVSSGGALVGPRMAGAIQSALDAKSTIWRLASQLTTDDGNDLPLPFTDDTGNEASIVNPNASRASLATDPTFQTAINSVFTFSSGVVLLSWELVQDASEDIETFVADRLAERIRRSIDRTGIAGSGANEPAGLVNIGTVGVTGGVGTASTFTWANLNDLESSVNAAYKFDSEGKNIARYILADDTFQFAKTLVDGAARQLWASDPSGRTAGTLRGFPVSIDDNVPAMAASAKSIIFGDLARGCVLRVVKDMRMMVFQEHFMVNGQVGILLELEAGFSVVDRNAFKLYQHGAS